MGCGSGPEQERHWKIQRLGVRVCAEKYAHTRMHARTHTNARTNAFVRECIRIHIHTFIYISAHLGKTRSRSVVDVL